VLVGVGVPDYPRGSKLFGPREWRGQIEYIVHDSCEANNATNSYSSSSPTTQSSSSLKTLVTRVTYLFNIEYAPYKVPSSGLLHSVSEIIEREVKLMLVSDDLESLHLFLTEVISTNEKSLVEYPCVPAKSTSCATVKTMMSFEHDATLSSERVTYEFLRREGSLVIDIEGKYYFTYIGVQAIEAQTEIILEGVPANEMGNDELAVFESATRQFLSNAIRPISEINGGVRILTVKVKQQNLKESPQTGSRQMIPSAGGLVRGLQESSSISLTILVTGAFQPPAEIDFLFLIKDFIDKEEEALINNLVNPPGAIGAISTGAAYFEHVKDINLVAQPPTPSPTVTVVNPTTSDKSIWSSALPKVIFIGSGIIIIIVTIILFFILRRKKPKKDKEREKEIKNMCVTTKDRRRSTRSMVLMNNSNEDLRELIHDTQLEAMSKREKDDFTVSTATSSRSGGSKNVRNFRSALEVVDEAGDEEESSTHSETEHSSLRRSQRNIKPKNEQRSQRNIRPEYEQVSRRNIQPEYEQRSTRNIQPEYEQRSRGNTQSEYEQRTAPAQSVSIDDESVAVSALTCNTGALSKASKSSRSRRHLDDDTAAVSALTWDSRASRGFRTI